MRIIDKFKAKSDNLKGAEPITIAFFGDSVTQGCFNLVMPNENAIDPTFDYESPYHAKLKKIFNLLFPRVPINIINAGISGGNAAEGVERIERDGLKFSPDLCIVCFGLNDSAGGDLELYKKSMREIFTRLQEKGVEVIHLTPNMMCDRADYPSEHPWIKDIVLRTMELQTSGKLKTFLEAGKEISKELNIPICDCYSKWEKLAQSGVNVSSLLYVNHPVPDMHWLFAFSLAEIIFEM